MKKSELKRRYARYLKLITQIKDGIEARYPSTAIIVHETDDWLDVTMLGSAPGAIFRIRRRRNKIEVFDITACRMDEKDFDTFGLIDLSSDYDDARLIDDFFWVVEPMIVEAMRRQRTWFRLQRLKCMANDYVELDWEDE